MLFLTLASPVFPFSCGDVVRCGWRSPARVTRALPNLLWSYQGLWMWHLGLEQGLPLQQRGSRKFLGRTAAPLGGSVARQVRKRNGNAIFPFLLHFCCQLELKMSLEGRGGGLLNVSCSVWREKSNCRCSGFQFQQIFSPAFSKPCTVHC